MTEESDSCSDSSRVKLFLQRRRESASSKQNASPNTPFQYANENILGNSLNKSDNDIQTGKHRHDASISRQKNDLLCANYINDFFYKELKKKKKKKKKGIAHSKQSSGFLTERDKNYSYQRSQTNSQYLPIDPIPTNFVKGKSKSNKKTKAPQPHLNYSPIEFKNQDLDEDMSKITDLLKKVERARIAREALVSPENRALVLNDPMNQNKKERLSRSKSPVDTNTSPEYPPRLRHKKPPLPPQNEKNKFQEERSKTPPPAIGVKSYQKIESRNSGIRDSVTSENNDGKIDKFWNVDSNLVEKMKRIRQSKDSKDKCDTDRKEYVIKSGNTDAQLKSILKNGNEGLSNAKQSSQDTKQEFNQLFSLQNGKYISNSSENGKGDFNSENDNSSYGMIPVKSTQHSKGQSQSNKVYPQNQEYDSSASSKTYSIADKFSKRTKSSTKQIGVAKESKLIKINSDLSQPESQLMPFQNKISPVESPKKKEKNISGRKATQTQKMNSNVSKIPIFSQKKNERIVKKTNRNNNYPPRPLNSQQKKNTTHSVIEEVSDKMERSQIKSSQNTSIMGNQKEKEEEKSNHLQRKASNFLNQNERVLLNQVLINIKDQLATLKKELDKTREECSQYKENYHAKENEMEEMKEKERKLSLKYASLMNQNSKLSMQLYRKNQQFRILQKENMYKQSGEIVEEESQSSFFAKKFSNPINEDISPMMHQLKSPSQLNFSEISNITNLTPTKDSFTPFKQGNSEDLQINNTVTSTTASKINTKKNNSYFDHLFSPSRSRYLSPPRKKDDFTHEKSEIDLDDDSDYLKMLKGGVEDSSSYKNKFTKYKNRIFLNMLKMFNLNANMFFNCNNEKELMNDPNFIENDDFQKEFFTDDQTESIIPVKKKSTIQNSVYNFNTHQKDFIKALCQRLAEEERQRLWAEEQSAKVICLMRKEIQNLEEQKKAMDLKLKEKGLNSRSCSYKKHPGVKSNNSSLSELVLSLDV